MGPGRERETVHVTTPALGQTRCRPDPTLGGSHGAPLANGSRPPGDRSTCPRWRGVHYAWSLSCSYAWGTTDIAD